MRERRLAALRGVSLLLGLIILCTLFLHHVVIPLFGISVAVRNDASPFSLLWLFGMVSLSVVLVLLVPRPGIVWTVGLLLGGALANAADRQIFGPVSDYILVPGSGDLYCNVPDLFIVAAPVLFGLLLLRNGIDLLLPPALSQRAL